ncbi:putative chemoreceptor glutamine deamidase CheD [Sphingobium jiangsuense]|uniref:Probable chemoreceptor glutamine deamidase CheD n=1 Tax=Sphingobium jiangsuense TaxID=870476 RepID=A0A7W6BGU3_9SPHN|nr:chemotaxis protein CheD [Sphingobium jiangsuense]MBB3924756.1 chemotaxis protein CheD [Sphingobium jiangsuense]GLT00392.1 putative chemoreceptor glutamine deamidase CheD [Sphingobium jiangsuense]
MFVTTDVQGGRRVRRVTVMQGQVYVGTGEPEMLTTVLGSCIACCLYDPVAQVGGMNHFLLAEPSPGSGTIADRNYGVYLMELLINQMMTRGGVKSRMKAHVYGGANMHSGMARIGDANALFARGFLRDEGIALVREDTGGESARRIEFDPVLGRTRCRVIEAAAAPAAKPVVRPRQVGGEVELF